MTKVLTDAKYYKAIADAIRVKNGSTTSYKPSGMAAAISAIQTDGGSAATYPKVRLKTTKNQVIKATPKLPPYINSAISSNDKPWVGYVDFDWYLSRGTPIQFEVTVSATEDNYVPGNLVVNGENIGSTKATLDIDKDLIIEAEDAKPISNFMPESYAVLYQKGAGAIVRVVSPSLSGGEETGTAVNENKTLICNVTDNAFDVISEMKVFVIYADGAQEAPVTLQKGSPVSAGAPYGEPQAIFAASRKEAMAIMASLGF